MQMIVINTKHILNEFKINNIQNRKYNINNNLLFLFQQEIILLKQKNNYILLYDKFNTLNNYKFEKKIMNLSTVCYIINYNEIKENINISELMIRYIKENKRMNNESSKYIEEIEQENEEYSDNDLYNITSWGADLSFRELITMYQENDLIKPELQRKYVWTKKEASRFIDSILLGLPIPSIFLANVSNNIRLIVDGYQRIMTIYDYVQEGIFGGDKKIFKLSNSEVINERWRGKSFNELTLEEQRKIKNTTIHAIIFEQKHPKNDTGMYQIFERINTSGKALKPQEIRNCVYQGSLNKMLIKLNENPIWRKIYGSNTEDARMSDIELILRFFAMNKIHEYKQSGQINLVKYLNEFMGQNKNINKEKTLRMERNFIETIDLCYNLFDKNAFRNLSKDKTKFVNKINPPIFDSISVAASNALSKNIIIEEDSNLYKELLNNEEYIEACSIRTTNIDNIKKRIQIASKTLFGIDYEW